MKKVELSFAETVDINVGLKSGTIQRQAIDDNLAERIIRKWAKGKGGWREVYFADQPPLSGPTNRLPIGMEIYGKTREYQISTFGPYLRVTEHRSSGNNLWRDAGTTFWSI